MTEIMQMKRALSLTATLLVFTTLVMAEELRPEPTQNPNAPFRLFNTKNIYTLLKLDTRDGRVWQLQWGDSEHRLVVAINAKALTPGGKPGRYTLYPTSNIFTFMLLDQETGESWQVQWSMKEDRFVVPIE